MTDPGIRSEKKRRFRKGYVFSILLFCCVFWISGFVWFVSDALKPAVMPPVCQGIVALTGGQGRIQASLKLLRQGKGKILLISGVNSGVRLEDLLPGIDPNLADKIFLGRRATSTAGNGAETAAWVAEHDIHDLVIVTAGYHMRRAMHEISRSSPGVRLYPYSVQPPLLKHRFTRFTMKLLMVEYMKWLLAEIGPAWVLKHQMDAQ